MQGESKVSYRIRSLSTTTLKNIEFLFRSSFWFSLMLKWQKLKESKDKHNERRGHFETFFSFLFAQTFSQARKSLCRYAP